MSNKNTGKHELSWCQLYHPKWPLRLSTICTHKSWHSLDIIHRVHVHRWTDGNDHDITLWPMGAKCENDIKWHQIPENVFVVVSKIGVTFFRLWHQPDKDNWLNSQIPHCTCSISHTAPFRTEMCTFLFWMVHCGVWNRCIVGFVRLVY